MTAPKRRKIIKINAIAFSHLIKNLEHGDMTCEDLAEATGLNVLTVYQYTRELHNVGAVHIARYEPDNAGRHSFKVYKLGEGVDAKRSRMTDSEKGIRYRQKKKALKMLHATAGQSYFQQVTA